MPAAKVRCVTCQTRWKQHSDGRCRSCHVALEEMDPSAKALAVVRRYISRQRAEAHMTGNRLAQLAAIEAANAFDIVAARLRVVRQEIPDRD